MEKEKQKRLIEVGGAGAKWGNKYRQQYRVYDPKGVSVAMNASGNNGLFIKKWIKQEEKESS